MHVDTPERVQARTFMALCAEYNMYTSHSLCGRMYILTCTRLLMQVLCAHVASKPT